MGCGGRGFYRFFDLIDDFGCCGNKGFYHERHYEYDKYDEMITVIDRLYAEGKIDTEYYQRLRKEAAIGNLTMDDLMRIEINSQKKLNREYKDMDPELKKYYDKLNQIDKAKEESEKIKNDLLSEIENLKRKSESLEKAAETMISVDEASTKDYIKEKIEIESKISTLEKRKQDLDKDISDMDELKNELNLKILELKSLKQRERLNDLKFDIKDMNK
ncbi:hypothetical protein Q2T46_12460 [Thermoanaerobacterium sp. CMT5567-10]|uniref:coiled-coil domain-containing protein n=1 Tax=Thermoanaerobacterium sp. CMT5567-10 TaxID=3061989 RepID=UPI0026E007A3|nr:hypothetical protein [Thermoanaerobacterium sp. CMT5567-10]WKV08335.1 hypothetical protein Q2T46_12460 [Thermoanaerobacterium sp. CMT5567-10]